MSEELSDFYDFSPEADKAFQEAEVDTKKDPPDGKYQVQIMKVYPEKKADKEGVVKKVVHFHFQILNGKYKGKYLFKRANVDNEVGLKWLKSDLAACGVELNSLSELKEGLESLLDKKLEVNKATNKKDDRFYSIYINKVIELDDEAEKDEDIPF